MAKGDYKRSWERVPEGPKPEGPPVYTPTTQEVRRVYSYGALERWQDDILILRAKVQGFDRWLASVRADAWDEGQTAQTEYERSIVAAYLDDAEGYVQGPANPYRSEKQ